VISPCLWLILELADLNMWAVLLYSLDFFLALQLEIGLVGEVFNLEVP